jgi:transposase
MKTNSEAERRTAIHLLRSGKTSKETAKDLGRSSAWVRKWRKRFQEAGWDGLQSRSRAPKHNPYQLPERVRQAIRRVRSELEAEARKPDKLSYVGSHAILARLKRKRIQPLPSISSIERELRSAGMTRPRKPKQADEIHYPHIQPSRPHQLTQVDIFPKYLTGGQSVACFNAIDVVSRYPGGKQYTTKRAEDAMDFLVYVWQTLGLSTYTQVDNEGCFSGGFTHPYVLGQVLRLGLYVGTELIFSPFYHPESNGFVERFHQEYDRNVWAKITLGNLTAVQVHSSHFFEEYRRSQHHSALQGGSPTDLHLAAAFPTLPMDFKIPAKLPLTVGRVHFIRLANPARQVRLLNTIWNVPKAQADQGLWATLEFSMQGASLFIFDQAPDVRKRTCLEVHPFPLKESVVPLQTHFGNPPALRRQRWWQPATSANAHQSATMS